MLTKMIPAKLLVLEFVLLLSLLECSVIRSKKWEINRTNKRFKLMDLFATSKIPTNSRKLRLYSRNGHFIGITGNGIVKATSDKNSKYAVLEMQSFGPAYRRIKGIGSKFYLALDKRGKAMTKKGPVVGTLFEEILGEDNWVQYKSVLYGWALAVRRNGKMRKKARVEPKKKSTQFLPVL